MPTKSIVVLANSIKFGGRCVAGKVVHQNPDGNWAITDDWLRPVSGDASTHGAVPGLQAYIGSARRMVQPLDIVDLDLIKPVPEDGQPENWLMANSDQWVHRGVFDNTVLPQLIEKPADIWLDNSVSSERLSSAARAAGAALSSLVLIEPDELGL